MCEEVHPCVVSFNNGDRVYLRVTPLKGTKRLHVKGKLAPRYIGPFKIIATRGEVAYQLELPSELSDVHNVFTCHNFESVSKFPTAPTSTWTSIIKPSTFSQTSLIVRGQFAFWMKLSDASEAAPSSTSRSNGATIVKQKQPGSVKTTLDQSSLISLALSLGISGTRFL